MNIEIGSYGWLENLKEATKRLGDDLWSGFTPVSAMELEALEETVGRKLPGDFKEFYQIIGYGNFEHGDGLFPPDAIVACLGAPIYFVLGSMMRGAEWATQEQHRRLWVSRGAENPAPSRFTDDVLTLDDVMLYDLMQFGSDGSCNYYQMHLGPEPVPFRCCLLTEGAELEERTASFSETLCAMLEHELGCLDSNDEFAP